MTCTYGYGPERDRTADPLLANLLEFAGVSSEIFAGVGAESTCHVALLAARARELGEKFPRNVSPDSYVALLDFGGVEFPQNDPAPRLTASPDRKAA